MEQMNLTQIGLRRIARDARPMFYRSALMRIPLDAEPRQQADLRLKRLAERMCGGTRNRFDRSFHGRPLILSGGNPIALPWRGDDPTDASRAPVSVRSAAHDIDKLVQAEEDEQGCGSQQQ